MEGIGLPLNIYLYVYLEPTKLTAKQADSADIWNAEEVAEGAQYDDVYDTRQIPEYVTLSVVM